MKVTIPAASSAIGISMRRGLMTMPSAVPTTAAASTGSLTRFSKKPGIALGSSDSGFWRPRSSAELEV